MPYASNDDLPTAVRSHLPPGAQDIYRAAFNSAWERYGPVDEGRIHRIAWGAVKRAYVRVAGEWVPRRHWRWS